MPQETNVVTLHPSEKDQFSLPMPNVNYDDHPYRTIETLSYSSTHNLGTCGMSEKSGRRSFRAVSHYDNCRVGDITQSTAHNNIPLNHRIRAVEASARTLVSPLFAYFPITAGRLVR